MPQEASGMMPYDGTYANIKLRFPGKAGVVLQNMAISDFRTSESAMIRHTRASRGTDVVQLAVLARSIVVNDWTIGIDLQLLAPQSEASGHPSGFLQTCRLYRTFASGERLVHHGRACQLQLLEEGWHSTLREAFRASIKLTAPRLCQGHSGCKVQV
jgi:hypothetical protein